MYYYFFFHEPELHAPLFVWGDLDVKSFCQVINAAYSEVLHWKGNLFAIPHGHSGKRFVRELSHLFRAFKESTSIECIDLAAIDVMPTLQNPSKSFKPKDHSVRRLILWEKCDINNLLMECRAI